MITNQTIGTKGRLGNQLFQYAFLYGQCIRYGRRAFVNSSSRGFDLHHFHTAIEEIVRLVPGRDYHAIFDREIVANWPEGSFLYSSDLAAGADGCSYSGYFQSPWYFEHCADELKRTLRIKRSPPPEATRWGVRIEQSAQPVVGIHVRLGDYLQTPRLFTNLQRTDYYERALRLLRERIDGPFTSLVFSDDIGWCESSGIFSGVSGVEYVSGLEHIWDLHLLKQCDHHIIANSSFSWWGAWLASRKGQIVVAPRQWFGPQGPPSWDTIYASGWIVLG